MTSRISPVGVLLIALAGLLAVGCTSETNAVFAALLDPAGTPPSPAAVADPLFDDGGDESSSPTWWPHPDGYVMELPAGWSGVALDATQTDMLIGAVGVSLPALAERMRGVLSDNGARVSAIAVDLSLPGELSPMLVVLAQPTRGARAHEIKRQVRDRIAALPGLSSGPTSHDATLPNAKGVRVFDFSIADPDVEAVDVRAYLFRWASQAYLVSFVAPADVYDDAEALFELIAASLRFGV